MLATLYLKCQCLVHGSPADCTMPLNHRLCCHCGIEGLTDESRWPCYLGNRLLRGLENLTLKALSPLCAQEFRQWLINIFAMAKRSLQFQKAHRIANREQVQDTCNPSKGNLHISERYLSRMLINNKAPAMSMPSPGASYMMLKRVFDFISYFLACNI